MTAYEPPEAAVEAGARAIREYPGVVYARADVAVPQVSKAVLTAAAPHLHRVFLDELIADAKGAMRDAQVRADHNPQDLEAAALAYATNTVHAWLSAYQLRAELAATEGETE